MKHWVHQFVLIWIGLSLTASLVTAQGRPEPVIRLGDWIEIGDDAFMNIIASTDIRYRTTTNYDFESDIQERVLSRNPVSSLSCQFSSGDCLWAETRFGADFRYLKNLKARVLFESQSVLDGNLIDDRSNSTSPAGKEDAPFAGQSGEDNGLHVERFWIDYTLPGTPVRMRAGAHLFFHDPAGLVADDDPGFFLYARLGPKKEWELKAAAVIQGESSRLGLTNDNDNIYYLGTVAYNRQPYRFALDVMYQRDRFNGPRTGTQSQKHDYALIMPSVTGKYGPLSGLFQFNLGLGNAEGTEGREFDIFNWFIIAQAELDLGRIKPVVGLIYASGDDDPTDDELNGFNNFAHSDISLVGFTKYFNMFDGLMNDWGPSPAQTSLAPFGSHTVYNWFHNLLGNNAHSGIVSPLSNPGTILIPAGVKLFPIKDHQVDLWYMYVGMENTAVLESLANRSIDKTLFHELGLKWKWTVNKHFTIQARGVLALPGDGSKDLAATVTCPDGNPCAGDDPLLVGELAFKAQF